MKRFSLNNCLKAYWNSRHARLYSWFKDRLDQSWGTKKSFTKWNGWNLNISIYIMRRHHPRNWWFWWSGFCPSKSWVKAMPSGAASTSRLTGLTPLPNPNPVGTRQEKGGCHQDGWWLLPKRHGCGSFKLSCFEKDVQNNILFPNKWCLDIRVGSEWLINCNFRLPHACHNKSIPIATVSFSGINEPKNHAMRSERS